MPVCRVDHNNMGERRSALRDVVELSQYREMLRVAARIDNRKESITIFFLLVAMGRLGMRVGEVIHMEESWYDPERAVISVPPHLSCDCGLCSHYARQYAKRHDLEFEDVLEEYWKVKDGSDRDIHVPTRRDRLIIELYFDTVPYTTISYSTVNRRLKKLAELTDGVAPDRVYPHMLRATAATHLLWSGFRPPTLDQQFGWQDEKTKERYAQKTAWRAKQDYDRIFGRDGGPPMELREDPPTYEEHRPEPSADRIRVESWEVDASVSSHPRTRDEEPLIHDINDFDNAPAVLEPISPALRRRLREERDAAAASDEVEYPLPPARAAALCLGLLSVAVVAGIVWGMTGVFYIDPVGREIHATPGTAIGLVLGFGLILRDVPEL